ncbi:histone acetyltransferase MYST1 [Trichuris trichiura]|uniref:Histone acetyltransferase MYST1 n=1 Tax=Trichuris trichiura TaxID=36087 RepID=A0A077Z8A7_TRITR|nr:histone acetyltransferase MYST1 [Trichuris trichiura]
MLLPLKRLSLVLTSASRKPSFGVFQPFRSVQLSAGGRASVFFNKCLLVTCYANVGVQSSLSRAGRLYSTDASADEDDDELLSIIGDSMQDNSVGDALEGGNLRSLLIEGDSPFLYRWYGHLLDFAHTTLGLPWWLSIAASALSIRLLLFPFITLVNQRNYSLYNNAIPLLLKHHVQISQARIQLDLKKIFEEESKLAEYSYRAKLATTGSQLFNISISATAFGTQFFALRKLALQNCEGLSTGGIYWFLDLTSKDPLLTIVTSFTYFLWMLIRMEQSVRIGGPGTVTALFGRFTVATLTVGSLFVFGSIPSATLCFCVTDFTLHAAFAMLYGTKMYRNLFAIPHPIVLSNPAQEGYIDLPSQVAKGYESGMGKIRAIRRANIAAIRSTGHGILLYDGDEIKEFFKKGLSKLIDLEVFLKSPNDYTEVSIEVRHATNGKANMLDHTDFGDHFFTIMCGLFGGILLLLLFATVIWGCAMIHERERETYISVP